MEIDGDVSPHLPHTIMSSPLFFFHPLPSPLLFLPGNDHAEPPYNPPVRCNMLFPPDPLVEKSLRNPGYLKLKVQCALSLAATPVRKGERSALPLLLVVVYPITAHPSFAEM